MSQPCWNTVSLYQPRLVRLGPFMAKCSIPMLSLKALSFLVLQDFCMGTTHFRLQAVLNSLSLEGEGWGEGEKPAMIRRGAPLPGPGGERRIIRSSGVPTHTKPQRAQNNILDSDPRLCLGVG